MESIFTMEFLWGLVAIVFIDLVLAGDNAIVIGMAARNLPAELQKKVIFWGTAGAIGIRALTTVLVVWLLKIPALMIIGGLLLLWIAYKLIVEEKNHDVDAASSFMAAVRTIIIADGVMGIDNVIGVAGVAEGNMLLIAIGILITVPIIIWGSNAFIQLIEKYPILIYVGGGLLAWTAGNMLTGDYFVTSRYTIPQYGHWLINSALVVVTVYIGWLKKSKQQVKSAPAETNHLKG